MKKILFILGVLFLAAGCGTTYKAKPLPFKAPSSYANAAEVSGATVAAQAYADREKAKEAFGFDIRGAGMLPVQVIFDNPGPHALKIVPEQTFLQDESGNLWPILEENFAYERPRNTPRPNRYSRKGLMSDSWGPPPEPSSARPSGS